MTRSSETWTVDTGDGTTTTATWDPATTSSGATFVCAHGAGGHMSDRSILAVTAALRTRGIDTVRFNFLYRERKQGRPDPMPRLLACYGAVVARVQAELSPGTLILGGRSMGGRAASMLVAKGAACDGLLLLAYPLHPPGRPEQQRVEHLASIAVPVLCINGTRDPFCLPDLMQSALAGLGSNWTMRWEEGGDHSFHVLKRSGRTDDGVLNDVADAAGAWIGTL